LEADTPGTTTQFARKNISPPSKASAPDTTGTASLLEREYHQARGSIVRAKGYYIAAAVFEILKKP
jgi:hypothetical protein